MPKNDEPKGGLSDYYRKAKFPTLKGPVSRIKPVKPIRLRYTPFVFKRRGIRLPTDFREYQESRAVPLSKVYGTLPERIVYKEFQRRSFDFDFQSSLLGGRQQLGGRVADYIVYLAYGPVIVRCQSYAFHSGTAPKRKDEEDKRILETQKDPYTNQFYVVYDLWEDVIFDPARLAEWIDRNLLGNYQGQGLRAPWAEVIWMPTIGEWDELQSLVLNQQAMLDGLQEQISHLMTMLGTGQAGPDFVIDNMNIRNLAITDAKINDLDVGKLTAGNIDVAIGITTGGSIQIGTGTKDSTLTGWIIDPDELVAQNAGVDQFYIDSSDGKAYFGAGVGWLDADGLSLVEGTTTPSKIKWLYGGTEFAFVSANRLASNDDRTLYVWCEEGTGNALVRINAGLDGLYDSAVILDVDLDDGIILDVTQARVSNMVSVVGGGISLSGGPLVLGAPAELTIASGVVTVTQSYHEIDTEGDAATDDLDTINGGVDGQILILRSAVSERDPTVKHGTGNVYLDGGVDFTLSNARRTLVLLCTGGTAWSELSRASVNVS